MPILQGAFDDAKKHYKRHGILGFVPPELRESASRVPQALRMGLDFIGPAADMQDAWNYSGATVDEFMAGNYAPALANLGNTGAAMLMTALPGNVSAVDDVVKAASKADLPMDTASRMKRADDQGYIDAYHGTQRLDRMVDGIRGDRATSGPQPFFTSDTDVASGYAKNKTDTSRLMEDDNGYENWFKFTSSNGQRLPLDKAWNALPMSERIRLREAFAEIGKDWDTDEIVRAADLDNTAGASRSHWDWTLKQHKGNALAAAKDIWLDSGNLYGDEEQFMKVLELAGVKGVEFDSPYLAYPGVIPAKLRIEKPFEATPENVADILPYLRERAPLSSGLNRDHGVDMWDKNHMDPELFLERLETDIADKTTYAWTSIPDWVTEALKEKGYDGIKDRGGKNGGVVSDVFIPFYENQIRSRFAKFDPAKKDSADLLASIGGAGLLGLGLTQRENANTE